MGCSLVIHRNGISPEMSGPDLTWSCLEFASGWHAAAGYRMLEGSVDNNNVYTLPQYALVEFGYILNQNTN
jgi:hypothetical protein